MRPEEHWQAGVDLIGQIEQLLAGDGRAGVDRDLYRLAKLHLMAGLGGAQLQQHYPARFAELTRSPGGASPAGIDALPGVTQERVLDKLRRQFCSEVVEAAAQVNVTCQFEAGVCVTPWHHHEDDAATGGGDSGEETSNP
jgi:hypothetical protein